MKKKSQIWYMDFIVGLTIFIIILFIAFRFISQNNINNADPSDVVNADAEKLSASLMSAGIPSNWTQDNVISLGILSDTNVLDPVKVDELKNLTNSGYRKTKFITGITSDYLIYFENNDNVLLNVTSQPYIGDPGMTMQSVLDTNPQNKVIFVRYVVYRHDSIAEIISMNLIVWKP